MNRKYLKNVLVVIFLFPLLPAFSGAQAPDANPQAPPREIIFKLEKMLDGQTAAIRNYNAEIRKCEATIGASENIIRKARELRNTKAEQVGRRALTTAREAKRKNEDLKHLAALNRGRIEKALAYVKKSGAHPEAVMEQVEYENMNAQWLQNQKQLIEQRLANPNPYIGKIYSSLRANAPPPLAARKYDDLQPGDVLLISPKAVTRVSLPPPLPDT